MMFYLYSGVVRYKETQALERKPPNSSEPLSNPYIMIIVLVRYPEDALALVTSMLLDHVIKHVHPQSHL